jgi:fermentation-respiration switch protein FrsA (DUF1100 family)
MRCLFLLPALLLAATSCTSIHDRIYQPPTARLDPAQLPAGAQVVSVTSSDGLTLTGAAVAARGDHPTLLVFHGNASSAATTLRWFAPLIARGYGVVAAEYRGYAGNPGRPDERGLTADADAFLALATRMAGSGRVFVVGHSLGGGVACALARRHRLDALITVGTFTRLRAMAPRIARGLIDDRFDNLASVATLDEPLFLIHGSADETVPPSQGNQLYQAARTAHKAGAAYVIDGAGHAPAPAMIDAVVEAIDARVERPGGPAPTPPAAVRVYPFD